MTKLEIGCCGAVCGTCRAFKNKTCIGCKVGYATGGRDLSKAKCKIKLCCIRKGFTTCADCKTLATCRIIQSMYGKTGYKYGKYRQATAYIKEKGYDDFICIAKKWNGPYGKYR